MTSFNERLREAMRQAAIASENAKLKATLAAQPERKPMMDEKKEELAGAWFAEDWAKKSAIGMLDEYEKFCGIKP
mgnify:FL=1